MKTPPPNLKKGKIKKGGGVGERELKIVSCCDVIREAKAEV
jgi:hypothetical protein